ncbi:MAG: type II secretion system protein [Gemmatimonadaceae bacterium]
MRAQQGRKRGFTLVETVVTVGIIAALAAVVYPSVVKQFDSADPTKVAEDLNSIRTGMEMFGVNVRPQSPGDIEDLLIQPDGADFSSVGVAYTASEQASWNGPYLTASVSPAIGQYDAAIVTGFGGTIVNRTPLFDLTEAGEFTVSGDTLYDVSPTTDASFVAVRITGLSGVAFNAVNLLLDGPNEDDVTERRTLGRLRCPQVAYADNDASCANAYYLAVPTRQ